MKKKQTYYVYVIKENDVIRYVGCTKDFDQRVYLHIHYQGGYGRNSAIPLSADLQTIKFEVVYEVNDFAKAKKHEDKLIVKYNLIEDGWNKQRSGDISKDAERKRYIRRMSARRKYKDGRTDAELLAMEKRYRNKQRSNRIHLI